MRDAAQAGGRETGVLQGGVRMVRRGEPIVGLDIGTTKVCAIVAERSETGIDIVGIGTHPAKGLRKGVVVDIDKRGRLPIIVGGTGLYFRALTHGLFQAPAPSPEIRARLQALHG